MTLDANACYRAVLARDPRFDGRFVTAVRTTGIYCRPICPARPPKFQNVVFYKTAAAAQEAGFRSCLRCRPEASPDFAVWRGTSNTVSRALALIADGALDGDTSVDEFAARLGVGERQLRRLFAKHLGASPLTVAHTRRVLFAKQLIHDTSMRMTDVALASGFGSLRRFNDTFRKIYKRPPSKLRREPTGPAGSYDHGITLILGYRPPYDWAAMIDFLAPRAIPGVEIVEPARYLRTIGLDDRHGDIEVAPVARRNALALTIRFPEVRAIPGIVARIKRVFDLGADIDVISTQLRLDRELAWRVDARPGLRVAGAWDGFELAVRAVLGQQTSVGAARQLAQDLVARFGTPIRPDEGSACAGLSMVFPSASALATADLAAICMPLSRARTITALAAETAADPTWLNVDRDPSVIIARLMALPGIDESTAQQVAMRALRQPDAFPAADAGLQRAVAASDGSKPSTKALLARAEQWRPWRAYAAEHLWACGRRADVYETPVPDKAVA